MARGTPCTGFVDYCMQMVNLLRQNGVEPYVVLDGARLSAKEGTEASRRASRERAIATATELLRAGPRERAHSEFLKGARHL